MLSVKLYPHDLLLKFLPSSTDIVCTHPMFGPESGKYSWKGLPFVYDVVRVDPLRKHLCEAFIDMWRSEGCTMVPMGCAQHDKYAASTQFITHTTGSYLILLRADTLACLKDNLLTSLVHGFRFDCVYDKQDACSHSSMCKARQLIPKAMNHC